MTALLGLSPDVPGGVLRIAPVRPSPVGALTVRGLRIAGGPLDLALRADGALEVLRAPDGVRVEVS